MSTNARVAVLAQLVALDLHTKTARIRKMQQSQRECESGGCLRWEGPYVQPGWPRLGGCPRT
eukprot:129493-Amphidinium_carterae.4